MQKIEVHTSKQWQDKRHTVTKCKTDLQNLFGSLFQLTSEPPGRVADLKQLDSEFKSFCANLKRLWVQM